MEGRTLHTFVIRKVSSWQTELHDGFSLTYEGVADVVASDDNEVGVAVVIAMGMSAIREEVGVAAAPEPARAFNAGCWRAWATLRIMDDRRINEGLQLLLLSILLAPLTRRTKLLS